MASSYGDQRIGASHTVPNLSLWGKITLVAAIARLAARAIISVIASLIQFRITNRHLFGRYLLRGLAQNVSSLSLQQERFIMPTTGDTAVDFCATQKLVYEAVKVEPGQGYPPTTLHFVGCKPDRKDVLLYIHGGGYTFPGSPGHVSFAYEGAQRAKSGLCLLEYGLAPELKYPGQLAQIAAAIRHLLKERDASNIIIGGDSAGGTLTLALLAHIMKPHPKIQELVLPEGAKLKGALCISPRTDTGHGKASYTYNAPKDILSVAMLDSYKARYQSIPTEVWCIPMVEGRDFWVKAPVERVILLAGGDELFLDGIREFAPIIGAEEKPEADRQLVVCPGEAHVQCVMDARNEYRDGVMLQASMAWLEGTVTV